MRIGVIGTNKSVANMLAHDSAVLAFHQRVVGGPVGPTLGEFDEQFAEQIRHILIDEFRSVVAVKAQNAKWKLVQNRFQNGYQDVAR